MADDTPDQLSRLVRERRAELGLSLAKVEKAAEDPDLTANWINRLELGVLRGAPSTERLASLAKGLRLDVDVVGRAAAAQFMGVKDLSIWSEDGSVQIVVAHMADLTPEGRRDLAEMVEIYARGHKRR